MTDKIAQWIYADNGKFKCTTVYCCYLSGDSEFFALI